MHHHHHHHHRSTSSASSRERERESERCQRWQPSSSITLIFHNNMKNSVHRRGLMNCIFRVTLAFLMKLDESPQAGQLCLNWCWLCQGTSMATPLRETQTFHRLINLPFALSDNFSKNMWFKVWHLSQSDPGTLHPPAAPRRATPPLYCFVRLIWSEHVCCRRNQRGGDFVTFIRSRDVAGVVRSDSDVSCPLIVF